MGGVFGERLDEVGVFGRVIGAAAIRENLWVSLGQSFRQFRQPHMSSDPASPTIPPSTTQVRGAIRGQFLERVFERHTGRRIWAGKAGERRGEGWMGWGKWIGKRGLGKRKQ